MWRWTPISEGIRFDGHTLVVRIPCGFSIGDGRKCIVASRRECDRAQHQAAAGRHAGQELVTAGTLDKRSRGRGWQRMLDKGVYASVSDIGDAEKHLEELCRVRSAPRAAGARLGVDP